MRLRERLVKIDSQSSGVWRDKGVTVLPAYLRREQVGGKTARPARHLLHTNVGVQEMLRFTHAAALIGPNGLWGTMSM